MEDFNNQVNKMKHSMDASQPLFSAKPVKRQNGHGSIDRGRLHTGSGAMTSIH
jgi:hypothetical protein